MDSAKTLEYQKFLVQNGLSVSTSEQYRNTVSRLIREAERLEVPLHAAVRIRLEQTPKRSAWGLIHAAMLQYARFSAYPELERTIRSGMNRPPKSPKRLRSLTTAQRDVLIRQIRLEAAAGPAQELLCLLPLLPCSPIEALEADRDAVESWVQTKHLLGFEIPARALAAVEALRTDSSWSSLWQILSRTSPEAAYNTYRRALLRANVRLGTVRIVPTDLTALAQGRAAD